MQGCARSVHSKVRPRTFGRIAMGNAVLFILRSRIFLYSVGSGMNRVQVVLPGFSVFNISVFKYHNNHLFWVIKYIKCMVIKID